MTSTIPGSADLPAMVVRAPDHARAARRLGIAVPGSLGAACVMAGAAVTAEAANQPGALALLAVAGAVAAATRSDAQRWRAYRQMAGLELLIHLQYVSYRCTSGTWTVPWPDVRRVGRAGGRQDGPAHADAVRRGGRLGRIWVRLAASRSRSTAPTSTRPASPGSSPKQAAAGSPSPTTAATAAPATQTTTRTD